MSNLYKERCAMGLDRLGGYYSKHIQAMTSEGLHDKGDIAAELAHRDMVIEKLLQALESTRRRLNSGSLDGWSIIALSGRIDMDIKSARGEHE